jgi:hypothetical protein
MNGNKQVRTSQIPNLYSRWIQPSYEVRVRGTIYLWGSDTLTENIKFTKPLLLHIRNDVFGEDITLGTQTSTGTKTNMGVLKPGQCVSIPVQNISGVFATCDFDSKVGCVIKG